MVKSCTSSSQFSADWSCENALDESTSTAWATSGEGVGSWIEFEFNKSEYLQRMIYDNRDSVKGANKKVLLEFSDGTTQEFDLDEDETTVELAGKQTTSVKITVQEVYSTHNNGAKEITFERVGKISSFFFYGSN
jgi:phage baseplate assembly protein gpV